MIRSSVMTFAAALGFSLVSGDGYAGDLGRIDKVQDQFNRTAASLGSDMRAVLKNCSAEKARVCIMSITGNVGAIASSSTSDHSRAQDLTIILAKDTDPQMFTLAVVVALTAWSPKTDKAERGQAFKVLLAGLKSNKNSEVVLESTKFKLMPLGVAGVWFLVEPQ